MKSDLQDEQFMKENFQKSFGNMVAPEELKTETLKSMMKAAAETEQAQNKQGKKTVWRYLTVAAVFCFAVFLVYWLMPNGVSYVTKMEDGVYYDEVELKDGMIHFVNNKVAISITPNAGKVTIGQETEEKVVEENQESDVLLLDNGGMITFEKTKEMSLPEIAQENWSYIGEQQIYVTVLKTEKIRYQAVYEKAGTTYEVIAIGTTQKEFIDFLYKKIKENK